MVSVETIAQTCVVEGAEIALTSFSSIHLLTALSETATAGATNITPFISKKDTHEFIMKRFRSMTKFELQAAIEFLITGVTHQVDALYESKKVRPYLSLFKVLEAALVDDFDRRRSQLDDLSVREAAHYTGLLTDLKQHFYERSTFLLGRFRTTNVDKKRLKSTFKAVSVYPLIIDDLISILREGELPPSRSEGWEFERP